MDDLTQMTLRVPKEWVARLDKIAETLSRPGSRATRSIAIRYALGKGIEASEAIRGIKTRRPVSDTGGLP